MLWNWAYPPQDECCAAARHAAAGALLDQGVEQEALDRLVLLVAELVANAIRHAKTGFRVTAELDAGRARVSVHDGDLTPPVLVVAAHDATSGRGLQMVAGVADAWGWETADRGGIAGKIVWAEVVLARPN
jgi:anti-sigma regulatory factor (Ser/Thr protein kinase)